MKQTLKKMEPRRTEPSGNQLNKLWLNGTGIHRTFLGPLSKLNSITAHRIFQNPLSQLRIKWNQSSHNVWKPTEQAQNSTAPEHTEPPRTHQANFNQAELTRKLRAPEPSAVGQATLCTRPALRCARLSGSPAAWSPTAAQTADSAPLCVAASHWSGVRGCMLLLLMYHEPTHWHHLDLVKVLPPGSRWLEGLHLTRLLNYL